MQEAVDKAFIDWWHSRATDGPHQSIYDIALNAMPNLNGARIVDFGSGTGVFAQKAVLRGIQHVTGVDYSHYALDVAERFLREQGIGCTRDKGTSLDAQVLLVESKASNTGLQAESYTHATLIFPSINFENGKPVDLSEKVSLDIIARLYPSRPMVFDYEAERDNARRMLKELKDAPNIINNAVLDEVYKLTHYSQVFQEAFRLLKDNGYFLVVSYQSSPRLSPGGDILEEHEVIARKILSFGDPLSYRVVSSQFVDTPDVYDDMSQLNGGRMDHQAEPLEITSHMFKGVHIFLIQKWVREK